MNVCHYEHFLNFHLLQSVSTFVIVIVVIYDIYFSLHWLAYNIPYADVIANR